MTQYQGGITDNTANRAELVLKVIRSGTNTILKRRAFVVTTDAPGGGTDLYGGERLGEGTDFCFRALSVLNQNAVIVINYGLRLVKN